MEIIKKKERYKTKCGLFKYFCRFVIISNSSDNTALTELNLLVLQHEVFYSHKQTSADTKIQKGLYNTTSRDRQDTLPKRKEKPSRQEETSTDVAST